MICAERGRAERGFTLLEVLVAFIIAALALAVLFRGVSEGLQAVQVASGYDQALSRARSRLDGFAGGGLVAGEQSGDDGGGFHWRTRVAAVTSIAAPGVAAADAPAGLPPPRLVLYDVSVAVSWQADGRPRQVRLDSQRLGITRPAPP